MAFMLSMLEVILDKAQGMKLNMPQKQVKKYIITKQIKQ